MIVLAISDSETEALLMMALAMAGALLFVVLLLGCMYFIGRSRTRRQGIVWEQTATKLGLRLAPYSDEMSSELERLARGLGAKAEPTGPVTAQMMIGTRADRPVQVFIRRELEKERHDQLPVLLTCCRAELPTPLAAGLLIQSRGTLDRIGESIFGVEDVEVGYPPFDGPFRVQTRDERRARALLSTSLLDGRAMAEHLAAAHGAGYRIVVSETAVRVEMKGVVVDAKRISEALALATDLASRFEQAAHLVR